jgi:hypothetical protein
MASLDAILNSILSESVEQSKVASARTSEEKVASAPCLQSPSAQGLQKIAELTRSIKVEPTYQELYTFIGGLYGRR